MLVTSLPNSNDARFVQPLNVSSPIITTHSGTMKDEREEQPINKLPPRYFIIEGILTDKSEVQLLKHD